MVGVVAFCLALHATFAVAVTEAAEVEKEAAEVETGATTAAATAAEVPQMPQCSMGFLRRPLLEPSGSLVLVATARISRAGATGHAHRLQTSSRACTSISRLLASTRSCLGRPTLEELGTGTMRRRACTGPRFLGTGVRSASRRPDALWIRSGLL